MNILYQGFPKLSYYIYKHTDATESITAPFADDNQSLCKAQAYIQCR